jgi:hypothetical protein
VEKLGLNSTVLAIAGNRHILIFPPSKKIKRTGDNTFPFMGQSPYTFVAHYDRVEGSPGANDNSIAVFMLLRASILLAKQFLDNWMIIFTDKEEITQGESFDSQGSYTLAQQLRALGLDKAKIYNFDACGTGDTLIFSTLTDLILGNSDNPNAIKIKSNINQLRNHALETAHYLRLDKVMLAPTPFCDDMGFLRAGFAAQTITLLPSSEAEQYEEVLRKYPEFNKLLISGEIKKSPERKFLPQTWKIMNTPADTPDRLTPQNFDQIVNFIIELCRK